MGDFVSFSNLIAEYTNKGTLASVTYIGQLLEYSYDRYDRLIGIDETRSDTSYHTDLQYDNYSRVANKTYPSGYKVYYEYFPNGSKNNVKDAQGNLRDPQTWSANLNRTPRFDRGFTGHEHLYAFGLINMNGRMYDPLMSSFLSPDNYIQDPTTQQGFNRYAYCAYNPLKYVDPSGEQYFGWNGGSYYYMEQLAMQNVLNARYIQYEQAMASTWFFTPFINALYSMGNSYGGCLGGHGCGGPSASLTLIIDSEDFNSKCNKIGITPGQTIPKEKWTNEFIKQFQEVFFPDAPMECVKKIIIESRNDLLVAGRTIPFKSLTDDCFTGNSIVYFNTNYINDPETLYYTMGHEFIHVSQFAELKGVEIDLINDPDFIMTIEYHAKAWEKSVGGVMNNYYDSFEKEMINCYSSRYKLDFTYYKWALDLIHP